VVEGGREKKRERVCASVFAFVCAFSPSVLRLLSCALCLVSVSVSMTVCFCESVFVFCMTCTVPTADHRSHTANTHKIGMGSNEAFFLRSVFCLTLSLPYYCFPGENVCCVSVGVDARVAVSLGVGVDVGVGFDVKVGVETKYFQKFAV